MEKTLLNTRSTGIQVTENAVSGEVIDTHQAILESDGNVVSVMKNSYIPYHNQQFVDTTEQMAEITGFETAGYSRFYGGGVVLAHLKNNQEDFKIGDHKIEDYIVLGNSHNGSKPFFVGTTTNLIRCANQFSQITTFESIKHTKSSVNKFEQLMAGFRKYVAIRKMMYQKFEMYQDVKVDENIKEMVIRNLLSMKAEDKLEDMSTRKAGQFEFMDNTMIAEMEDLGQNLWGLFNGATRYVRDLEYKNKGFGNVLGTGQQINQRAYTMANGILSNHEQNKIMVAVN